MTEYKTNILRGARTELKARGLHKGSYFRGAWGVGPCDVYAACILAAHGDKGKEKSLRDPVWVALAPLLIRALPPGVNTGVATWVDRPDTKLEEVLALLTRAIALVDLEAS